MKVNLLFCILLIGFIGTVSGQDFVAVVPFGAEKQLRADEAAFREMLKVELDKRGLPIVTRDFGGILNEAGFQQDSGLVDHSTMASIGSATGAKYVAYGTFKYIWGSYNITCSILEIETGILFGSGRVGFDELNYRNVNQGVMELVDQMLLDYQEVERSESFGTGLIILQHNYSDFYILPDDLGGEYSWSSAQQACEDLNARRVGGYADWRLPTLAEFQFMYDNKNQIGGFSNSGYWSAT